MKSHGLSFTIALLHTIKMFFLPCHVGTFTWLTMVANPELLFSAGLLVVLVVKNPLASAGDTRHVVDPWVWKIPWRRKQQPTLIFFPGESHRQRNLVGYSPQGLKESDRTKRTQHTCMHNDPRQIHLCWRNIWQSLCLGPTFLTTIHTKCLLSKLQIKINIYSV